jgi:uncharacterized membrane protein YdjX (TVP38/TMEM64 family)
MSHIQAKLQAKLTAKKSDAAAAGAYERMPDVVLQDLSQPLEPSHDGGAAAAEQQQAQAQQRGQGQAQQPGGTDDSMLHSVVAGYSWLVHPKTTRQKVVALSFWAAVLAGFITVFVVLFPKLVDNVIQPFVETLHGRLSHVEIALVAIAAMVLLPIAFITHTPFIWLCALTLGFWRAVLVVELGTMLGAALTFGLGKTLLHRPALRVVARWVPALACVRPGLGPGAGAGACVPGCCSGQLTRPRQPAPGLRGPAEARPAGISAAAAAAAAAAGRGLRPCAPAAGAAFSPAGEGPPPLRRRYEKVRAVLLAVDQAGAFKVVLLMRMGPIPFSVCNYACSIPHTVQLHAYLLASFVGLLPYNLLEVYLGHNIQGISGGRPGRASAG